MKISFILIFIFIIIGLFIGKLIEKYSKRRNLKEWSDKWIIIQALSIIIISIFAYVITHKNIEIVNLIGMTVFIIVIFLSVRVLVHLKK